MLCTLEIRRPGDLIQPSILSAQRFECVLRHFLKQFGSRAFAMAAYAFVGCTLIIFWIKDSA